MSKEWLMWEIVAVLSIILAVFVIPEMDFWRYMVLGLCFGLHSIAWVHQDGIWKK